jgi:hypothetical protein
MPLMKKAAPYLVLILLAILVIFLKHWKGQDGNNQNVEKGGKVTNKRNRGFDRTLSYIEYTVHAKCRMKCRHISQEDIEDIMRNGQINYSKSEVNESPCPVYAVQGYTHDREHIRVIFGQCDNKTKVITCYNLDQEFECHCPGDPVTKYEKAQKILN